MPGLPTPVTVTDMLLAAVHDHLVGFHDELVGLRADLADARGGEPATSKPAPDAGQIELTEPKPAKAPRKPTR